MSSVDLMLTLVNQALRFSFKVMAWQTYLSWHKGWNQTGSELSDPPLLNFQIFSFIHAYVNLIFLCNTFRESKGNLFLSFWYLHSCWWTANWTETVLNFWRDLSEQSRREVHFACFYINWKIHFVIWYVSYFEKHYIIIIPYFLSGSLLTDIRLKLPP